MEFGAEVLTNSRGSYSRHTESLPDSNPAANSHADQLERCGTWLSSIPRDDVSVLRETQEYCDFLRAFERLGRAHRRVISSNRNSSEFALSYWSISNNFLQYLTADDVILRIFEFLECKSLIRMAFACSRFRQLAYKSAAQRTCDMRNRKLRNVMELLRAKEQIEGVGSGIDENHVRVPILLLRRRMLVTDAGDPEYNGIYFCTGCNGNGFVFTKPRFPEHRVQVSSRDTTNQSHEEAPFGRIGGDQVVQDPEGEVAAVGFAAPIGQGRAPIGVGPSTHFENEVAQPGQLLRCIIAKRFSNETILWYLSKEVGSSESQPEATTSPAPSEQITQVFSFWAKLMVVGDASPDICRYPSQSSILARHGERWNSLATSRDLRSPSVELLE